MKPSSRLSSLLCMATCGSIATAGWVGCRPVEPPLARMASHPAHAVLPYPGFFEVEIEIEPLRGLLPGAGTPIVFLHLLDSEGQLVRTFDRPLSGRFEPGLRLEHRVRLYQSALADPLEPGEYRLTVGLYDTLLGRYELATADRREGKGEYRVGVVEVPELARDTPALRFSELWLPAEAGQDLQILAWRPLGGEGPGAIQLAPLSEPGKIVLGLEIPRPETGSHLELRQGAEDPRVEILADCAEDRVEIAGFGFHEVAFDVPRAPANGVCGLEFRPNFRIYPRDRKPPISIRLGLVAWSPRDAG